MIPKPMRWMTKAEFELYRAEKERLSIIRQQKLKEKEAEYNELKKTQNLCAVRAKQLTNKLEDLQNSHDYKQIGHTQVLIMEENMFEREVRDHLHKKNLVTVQRSALDKHRQSKLELSQQEKAAKSQQALTKEQIIAKKQLRKLEIEKRVQEMQQFGCAPRLIAQFRAKFAQNESRDN